jgi:RNA polymerase sigma factor for flagellar operon FliA
MNKAEIERASEEDLWKAYKKTHDPNIRDDIVRRYAFLVKSVVGKIAATLSKNVDFNDLLSYGTMGLLDAIEKFEPDKNFKFSTYAITRIRGSIYDELRAIDWIPRSVRQKTKELEAAYANLENRLGRTPKDEEIAKEMGLTEEELSKVVLQVSGTSISSLNDVWSIGGDDDELAVIETVEGPHSLKPDLILQRTEVKGIIVEAINELPEKEKQIVVLYYYEDLTLKEIGQVLDLTESRVSQLHGKAMLRLRSRLSNIKDHVE